MSRAYVICHMLASLDGKIDGHFMSAPESAPAIGEYARLRSEYGCRAVIYGTTTMAEGFADGVTDELPHAGERYFQEDYAAPSDVQNYIVSIDPKGVLKWSSKYIERKNRPRAHIIEVLTEQVPNDYLAYLRSFDISYIFAGRERLDCRMLLRKLKERFGIDRVMLAGGGLPAKRDAFGVFTGSGAENRRRQPLAALSETVRRAYEISDFGKWFDRFGGRAGLHGDEPCLRRACR